MMRGLSTLLASLSLAAAAHALSATRHGSHQQHHSHAHARASAHAAVHEAVHAQVEAAHAQAEAGAQPCSVGFVRVFQPQLGCAQLSPPNSKDAVDLVVITETTCTNVLDSIRTKTAPYWDPEMNRCSDESRTGLLTQCAQKVGSNFSLSLQVGGFFRQSCGWSARTQASGLWRLRARASLRFGKAACKALLLVARFLRIGALCWYARRSLAAGCRCKRSSSD
jgi:hypothetical protein